MLVKVSRGRAQDFDLLEVGDNVVVGRNAAIFCHVGIYRAGGFVIDQAVSKLGDGAVLGARCATVMGFNAPPGSQLGVLELGFKPMQSLPAGLDLV